MNILNIGLAIILGGFGIGIGALLIALAIYMLRN